MFLKIYFLFYNKCRLCLDTIANLFCLKSPIWSLLFILAGNFIHFNINITLTGNLDLHVASIRTENSYKYYCGKLYCS